MLTFIVEMVMIVSFAAVLYVVIRVLPRVEETEVEGVVPHHVVAKLTDYFERFDAWFAFVFEKFLRRVRVLILKLDIVVSRKLSRFKKENGNGHAAEAGPLPDIADILKDE